MVRSVFFMLTLQNIQGARRCGRLFRWRPICQQLQGFAQTHIIQNSAWLSWVLVRYGLSHFWDPSLSFNQEGDFYHLMTISWPLWMSLQTPAWFYVDRCPRSQKQLSQLAIVVTRTGSSMGSGWMDWRQESVRLTMRRQVKMGNICNITNSAAFSVCDIVNSGIFYVTSAPCFKSRLFGYF